MSRWAGAGVLDTVFTPLQKQSLVQVRIEAVSPDSTIVKRLPDGTEAPQKKTLEPRQELGRVDPPIFIGLSRVPASL